MLKIWQHCLVQNIGRRKGHLKAVGLFPTWNISNAGLKCASTCFGVWPLEIPAVENTMYMGSKWSLSSFAWERLQKVAQLTNWLIIICDFCPSSLHPWLFSQRWSRQWVCAYTARGAGECMGLYAQSWWPWQAPVKARTKATARTHYNTTE